MVNIKEIKESVSNDGAKLIYQSLDGLNWKQITCKDINLNIDLIISYIVSKNLSGKNVLSLSMNCLDSFVLESCFFSMGCQMTFMDASNSKDVKLNKSYGVIIVDNIEVLSNIPEITESLNESIEIITIDSFQDYSKYKKQVKSIKNIYKIGLLSRKDLDADMYDLLDKQEIKDDIQFISNEGLSKKNNTDFKLTIEKYKKTFQEIKEKEFSACVYLKEDLFSKCVNYFFITCSRKFTNSKSLTQFIENANEIMPKHLVIDSYSLDSLIEMSSQKNKGFLDLIGSRARWIITYNYNNSENIKRIEDGGIEIISF